MKKKVLSIILVMFILCGNICLIPVSAASSEAESATSLTFEQICTALEELTGVDYSDFNYYITRGPAEEYSSQYFRNYSIILCQRDPENEVHIINDNYAENQASNNVKIVCTPDLNSTYTAFNFRFGLWHDRDLPDIWGNWESWTRPNDYPDTVIHVAESTFYESNMPVYVGDEQLNRSDYELSLFYLESDDSVYYRVHNESEDLTFGARYGLRSGNNSITKSMTIASSSSETASISLQEVRDFATHYGADVSSVEAYLTLYDGINVVDSRVLTIQELINGETSGDEYFANYEEYEDMPDPSDYFDDPPDFPTLEPMPDFPGFDPEHPWQSLFDILRWLGNVIATPFRNLWLILRWIVDSIIYYISNGFLFLKDCFTIIIHNLQHLIHNLVVKLRILLTSLFVPSISKMKQKVLNIPIIAQIRGAFAAASTGNHSITITILDRPCTISALDSIGTDGCSIFYNLSTVTIYATGAFGLFNLILSIFGIHLNNGGE